MNKVREINVTAKRLTVTMAGKNNETTSVTKEFIDDMIQYVFHNVDGDKVYRRADDLIVENYKHLSVMWENLLLNACFAISTI